MKKETIYKICIIFLLVLNLTQICWFVFSPKPPRNNRPMEMGVPNNTNRLDNMNRPDENNFRDEFLMILDLDKEQKTQFKKLAKNHDRKIFDLQENQKKLTAEYFMNPSDSILNLIKEIGAQKIIVTENHFKDIKKILREDQYPKLKKFRKRALDIIIHP
ncbi:MAG: hypothetical protein WC140_06370 [Bacteroidales bacterium]